MLPPHWKTLQPLLDEALDAAPAERAVLMNRWRSEHPDLAEELQRLLLSHEQAQSESFLQGEPAAAGLFGAPLAGQQLGAYTLQEPIGEGGMGSVWLARRHDGHFEGVVAVKLLSLSLAGPSRAERFRREGHILARLAHPHIARLIDAGVSPSGQPYLVLEHVQGRHVDVHCDAERLGLRTRIGLFLTLLDAVQHAHSHLVVHRDIKPSNVMVDADGQLKLLDFGIAKLMTGEGDTLAPLTQQAGALLSPGYAAPEQLQSGSISTATDVYSLGVLLYVLLSGRHPTTQAGSSAAQALHDTLLRDPPLMSVAARNHEAVAQTRGLRSAALVRALAGDLDNITAKALQRDPALRYASAAAMADDLRRHLNQQPVQARAPSASYLLGRFLKRHRGPVAATAFGLLVAGALGAQSWQERQAARLSQTQAQTVDGLLQSLFGGMSPDVAANRSFSAKELLDRGQAFLDSRGDVDPVTRRSARLRMAELYRDVGAYKEAATAFKTEATEAGQAADFAGQQRALWQWANVLVKTLDTDAAARAVVELEQVLAAHAERSPGIDARMALLRGELALTRRQSAEAEKSLAQAESLLDSERDLELAARAALGQGMAAKQRGDVVRARSHMDRAKSLQDRRGADAVIDRLAVSLQIGTLENWAGRHAAATAALTQTDIDLRARLGAAHPFTVASASELAYAALRQGRFEEVQHHLRNVRGSTGPADAWREDYADLMATLVQLYSGHAAGAVPELRRLLKAMERDEGGVTPATEPMRRLHGEALLRANRVAEAEAVLRQTEGNQAGFSSPDPFGLAATRLLLACAWARQGRVDLAGPAWQDAATVMSREVGAQHPSTLLATSYAALLAPAGSPAHAQRPELAARLQKELPWLDGTSALAAILRDTSRPPDWRRLPVAL